MPRSRSRSIESRYCARMSRASTAPVSSRMRSASVRLAVVDVGDDREVADAGEVHGRSSDATGGPAWLGAGRAGAGSLDRLFRSSPTDPRGRPVANIKSQIKRNLTEREARRAQQGRASELKTRVKTAARPPSRRRRRRRRRCAWP